MRKNLLEAILKGGMTPNQVAEYLVIHVSYYRFYDAGTRGGYFVLFDSLEDLFGIHQRILREISPDQFIK